MLPSSPGTPRQRRSLGRRSRRFPAPCGDSTHSVDVESPILIPGNPGVVSSTLQDVVKRPLVASCPTSLAWVWVAVSPSFDSAVIRHSVEHMNGCPFHASVISYPWPHSWQWPSFRFASNGPSGGVSRPSCIHNPLGIDWGRAWLRAPIRPERDSTRKATGAPLLGAAEGNLPGGYDAPGLVEPPSSTLVSSVVNRHKRYSRAYMLGCQHGT